ncbi:MAG: VTT domain-containing protein [Patescibacteria group bacterium]
MTAASETSIKWLRSKYAEWILAGIAFSESMFAPILIDPFLVALIIAQRELWKRYILVSVIASVIGGIAGYLVGIYFFDLIGNSMLQTFGLEQRFNSVAEGINQSDFVFVLLGAFTPIPYKLVALASGFLQINIVTFIIASIFGRFFRLGLVGFAAYAVGPKALPVMQRNLHLIAAIAAVLFAIYIISRVM